MLGIMEIKILLEALTAFGTTGMALIVFYLQIVKGWIKRPKIRIEFEQEEPYCKEVPLVNLQNIQSYWMRIKVENVGREIAQGVEGRLTEIKDKNKKPIKEFVPLVLRWSSRPYAEIPDIKDVRMDINRGASWFLDVIFIADTRELKSPEREKYKDWGQKAHICDIYAGSPTGTPRDLDPGEYYITITIYGNNIQPFSKTFYLMWTGKYKEISLKPLN